MRKMCVVFFSLALLAGCQFGGEKSQVIRARGSSTLQDAANALAARYQVSHPEMKFVVSGGGSGHGIDELMLGRAEIANASRKIKSAEVRNAKAIDIDPKEHIIGYDAVAMVVHPDNPLREINVAQIAEIYAQGGSIDSWSAFEIEVPGCDGEVMAVGRSAESGTRGFFTEAVLGEREHAAPFEEGGNEAVIDRMQRFPCAIAYISAGSVPETLRALRVCDRGGSECHEPSTENAIEGSYSLARPLFMYTQGDEKTEDFVVEYLDWILSDEGQCVMVDSGFAPVRDIQCRGVLSGV